MKQALILQGWYQTIDSNWYLWLKNELEKRGYTVFFPDLPTMHTDLPDMQKQLEYIKQHVSFEHDTVVIGHSLGCLLAMRLAEEFTFSKMILVAGWDFNDLTKEHQLFWKNPIDHEKIKSHVKEMYCISSDNDPYMTAFTVEAMSNRLGAKFVLVKDKGHFTSEDNVGKIPEVLDLLK